MYIKSVITTVMATVLALGFVTAHAADKAPAKMATQKVVLQLSDDDPGKQTLVLNVANNLLKAFDDIQIEIVAFGPGLKLLFKDNENSDRIQALAASNVKFAACGNTMRNMGKVLGKEPELNTNAVRVEAGIGRILELTGQGYTLVRP